jgi:VWFA-related protein
LQLHERGLKKLKKRITKQAVRRKACGKPGVFQQPRLVSSTTIRKTKLLECGLMIPISLPREFRAHALSIFVLLIGAVLTAGGQSPPPQVLLPLIVVDHHGDPVSDLSAESLAVSDNKAIVSSGVKLLRGADFPLKLGILIDTSNSQRNSDLYETAVKGVKDFVNDALRRDQDRVFFEIFSTTPQATSLLTKAQVSGVSLPLQVGGATVLYDAIALACTERIGTSEWQNPVRRVLVILSDGEDNQSHITRAKAEAFPVSSGVVVFAISTNSSGMHTKGDNVLEKMSKATGGMAYTGVSRRSIPKIFAQIREQIDAMYYVTYVPPSNLAKDDVHSVDVKPAKGVKLEVRAPKLYAWNP